MFHTLAFYDASFTATSYTNVTPIDDGVFGRVDDNTKLLVGEGLHVFAGWAGATNLTGARISSPSLIRKGRPLLRPWTNDVIPGSDPNVAVLLDRPCLVPKAERFSIEAKLSAGTSDLFGVLFVLQKPLRPLPAEGDFITLTGSVDASTGYTWEELPVTWDETLPNGRYAVIGSECISPSGVGVAHRWIFDNQQFRPGALSVGAMGERTHRMFYDGKLGVWGEFTSQVPPRIEILTNGASSDNTVFLQVIRIGD